MNAYSNKDFYELRHILASNTIKDLINKYNNQFGESCEGRRRKLRSLNEMNDEEFSRLIGQCEKE